MSSVQRATTIRDLAPLMFVQDVVRALDFYERLGFSITASWERSGRLGWCRLERGSAAIMLQQAEEEDGTPEGRGRGVEFFFDCDDADALYAELVNLGVQVEHPRVAFYDMKQVFLKDPDGYALCFQSPLDRHLDQLGQPIGIPVPGWTPRERPPQTPMAGRFCRVEPLDLARHARDLYDAYADDREGRNWTYFPYGPFDNFDGYLAWLTQTALTNDPFFHAIIDAATGKAVGVAAFMRIDPPNGVIEVGHVHYSPHLQRTPAGTEAMYLMMRRVFDELGYRRYEWKCDSLNQPSRRAAERLGFTYEGIFRQATTYKGRNRDTAWFSLLDSEWPARKAALETWLHPGNFDEHGRQRNRL